MLRSRWYDARWELAIDRVCIWVEVISRPRPDVEADLLSDIAIDPCD